MKPVLEGLPVDAKKKLVKKEQPEWEEPMLATLTDKRFDDHGWIFGRKLDGERCIAYKKNGRVRLMSRNRHLLNTSYPEVAEALEKNTADDFIVDGEIVALDAQGQTRFELLQPRMGLQDPNDALRTGVPVHYYIFDMLYYDGHDITRLGVIDRKYVLAKALDFRGLVDLLEDRIGGGIEYYKEACRSGWEGLIAKRGDSPYVHGRSDDWLKFKCIDSQEFVIGGYTDPHGKRTGFGAILVGYYRDDKLIYAGKVGTGYDDRTIAHLMSLFKPLERASSPFSEPVDVREAHWLEPKLVAQIGFEEWTNSGKLRQPRYEGLRDDKSARDVIKEVPK
jgi:bifunctional non-homologous end joining protein LigD